MPRVAITSATLTASMPRSRKSSEATSTAVRRVWAASSRDRRTRRFLRIEAELLAEGAVEDACGQVAAQPSQRAGALAHRVAQARFPGGSRLEHCLGHDLRIVAAVHAGANVLAGVHPGRRVVAEWAVCDDPVGLEARAHESRLDQRRADAERARLVIE